MIYTIEEQQAIILIAIWLTLLWKPLGIIFITLISLRWIVLK